MIKAAVIGCGRMGAFSSESVKRWAPDCWFPLAHAEAIAVHQNLELAGLCDSSADNLQRARAAYGNPPGFERVDELVTAVRPKLAGIATRTVGRAEIIKTLFAGGTRAFHVEKPLCNSVSELKQIAAIFNRDEVFATYGTIRRFFHICVQARGLVESGRFGALREIRANMGEGSLFWVQPHAIDWILFAAKERKVAGVQARLGDIESGDLRLDIVNDPIVQSGTIWFADGVAGHIGRGGGLELVMSCETGEVIIRSDGRILEVAVSEGADPYWTREQWTEAPSLSGPQGSLAPISQLAACLVDDVQAIASNRQVKRDILRGQEITFAMVQSHWEGSRIVAPDEIDPAIRVFARTGGNFA